jgi:hypothetical protein
MVPKLINGKRERLNCDRKIKLRMDVTPYITPGSVPNVGVTSVDVHNRISCKDVLYL